MSANSVGCDSPCDVRTRSRRGRRRLGEDVVDGAADHQRDEVGRGRLGDQALADRAAVAEDRVAVGDPEDLLELVADEEDRLALALQLGDDRVELLDLLVGRARRSARP